MKLSVVCFVLALFSHGWCLRNVQVRVLPSAVLLAGQSATLECLFDLEGALLYSVKWYKGSREFYRRVPDETPQTKIFPFPGLNVDMSQSDDHRVHLAGVGLALAGNFSCEVSADAPAFSTAFVSCNLTVVAAPPRPPSLVTSLTYYEVGDLLRANCTSGPARPAPSLTFFLNKRQVYPEDTVSWSSRLDTDGLESSQLGLHVTLTGSHVVNDHAPLLVTCESRIKDVYKDSATIALRPRREPPPGSAQPKHERVTLPNQTSSQSNPDSRKVFLVFTTILVMALSSS